MTDVRLFRAEFATRIAAYCEARRLAETTFGLKAVNDATFVARLREGRVTLRIVETAEKYLDAEEARMAGHAPAPGAEAPAA